MKKYFFYLSMALVALVVASCGLKGNHTSSGRPYELLVVVDAGVWDRAAGRALHDVLDSDMPGLPQSEPSFRIMYTSPKDKRYLYERYFQICERRLCFSTVDTDYSGSGRRSV